MPSSEYAASSNRSVNHQANSYDKIIATINGNNGPSTLATNAGRIGISIVNSNKFAEVIKSVQDSEYQKYASADIGNIFAPFRSSTNGSGYPQFHNLTQTSFTVPSGKVSLMDLLPFQWDRSETAVLYDRSVQPSGDSLRSIMSGEKSYGDVDRYRSISDVRSIGLRLPIIGVGWGYTNDCVPMPSGSDAKKFMGETSKGYEVDPKNYIAAPIDLRYDRSRHVWTSTSVRILEGKIVVAPPGEEEFSDNRYWVEIQNHREVASSAHTDLWNPEPTEDSEFPNKIVPVTNLAEHLDGTHGLALGSYVSFYEVMNVVRDDGAKPIKHYIMAQGGGALPTPQYQFMVYQGLVANEAGFDYVRSHPTP